jgi:hypothetical protein
LTGKWIVDKIADCVPELISASTEFEELEESLRNLGASAEIGTWREAVEAWEKDDKKPNPFASTAEHKTVVDVRREMAEAVQTEMIEDAELEITSEEMHPTELIGMGLQLEELQ